MIVNVKNTPLINIHVSAAQDLRGYFAIKKLVRILF